MTSHVLTADGGCFTWTSRRPDVATVLALYEDENNPCGPGVRPAYLTTPPSNQRACSRAALVTSAWGNADQRGATVVTAREVDSGHEIRCDVFVDRIRRIEIVTTTKTVYLDDAPEVLDVLAFDNENNRFSTTDKIEYEWTLLPANRPAADADAPEAVDASTVLRVVDFKNSEYDASDFVDELEKRSKRGHMILVEGISSGRARVATRIIDALYTQSVPPSEVILSVMEKLELRPGINFLLPKTKVAFSLIRIRELHKQHTTIELPSPQYYLDAENKTVCTNKRKNEKIDRKKKNRRW